MNTVKTACITALLGATALASSCVRTKTPPDPPPQADVTYGDKIWLADHTQTIDEPPLHCVTLGEITGTASTTLSLNGEEIENTNAAVNCFVGVQPGTLKVDAVEVTNDLFQLCVDSGVCKKPNPGDVEKGAICDSEDAFDRCPVVSVQHFEAQRFCEFVGRRLPSAIEHLMIRQGIHDEAKDVPGHVTDPSSSCGNLGVLKECRVPSPVVGEDGTTLGAATGDRSKDGVFDLTGNVSEWAADLLPSETHRVDTNMSRLPWFCERPVNINDLGGCLRGEVCVMGWYDPGQGYGWGLHPVCYASQKLRIENGSVGAVFGGNYSKSTIDAKESGTFVRLAVPNPDKDPGEATRGFRCVGTSGAPEEITPVLGTAMGGTRTDAGSTADALPADTGNPIDSGAAMDSGTAMDAGSTDADPADMGNVADTGPTDTGTTTGGDM